ncbi:MAG: ABC transporter ATP-binding protein [Prochlorotrichaceae cyanobacterium]
MNPSVNSIEVDRLCKTYPVALKSAGLVNTLRHFFQRRYRYIEAVKPLSFTIAPGEIVGFLGPNGAGKTTTLKMLTGLIHPSSGSARIAGHEPFRRESTLLRQISLVMGQKQQLIWDLPAIDSLTINAAVYGLSDRETQERIDTLSEMLGVRDQLTQPVRKLSLGERMKAELLAALLHYPKILFLDEPTLGLDVNAQIAIRQFLKDYNDRFAATILLTSHYMADITALCQRVLVIHQGQLIYDGGLDALVEQVAPWREVHLDLENAADLEVFQTGNCPYGQVETIDGLSVRLLVDRETLTQTISQLLTQFQILDLSISDPPIEEVIGRVFQDGTH